MLKLLETLTQPVRVTNPTTAGGLTTADLLALIAIIVTIVGLLLSAIGVLVLLVIRNLSDRITELKEDTQEDLQIVWAELNRQRGRAPSELPSTRRRRATG